MNPTLVRWLQAPSIILLFLWMIVPLSMTVYFSTIRYHLLYPERDGFIGLANYEFFYTDPAFWPALVNTLVLVGSIHAPITAIRSSRAFFSLSVIFLHRQSFANDAYQEIRDDIGKDDCKDPTSRGDTNVKALQCLGKDQVGQVR